MSIDQLRHELAAARRDIKRLQAKLSESRRVATILLESHVEDPHAKAGYMAEWHWLGRRERS